MYNLFLDDIREPENITIYKKAKYNWIVVQNYDDFVNYIEENGLPNMISLDHDLHFEHYAAMGKRLKFKEKTGYDALIWLCEYIEKNNLEIPKIKFHTSNFVGMKNMNNYLYDFEQRYTNENKEN